MIDFNPLDVQRLGQLVSAFFTEVAADCGYV